MLCKQSGLQIVAKMWVTWSTPAELSLSPILELPFIWAELPSWNCHCIDAMFSWDMYEITMQGFAINLSSQDSDFQVIYFQAYNTIFQKTYLANKNNFSSYLYISKLIILFFKNHIWQIKTVLKQGLQDFLFPFPFFPFPRGAPSQ